MKLLKGRSSKKDGNVGISKGYGSTEDTISLARISKENRETTEHNGEASFYASSSSSSSFSELNEGRGGGVFSRISSSRRGPSAGGRRDLFRTASNESIRTLLEGDDPKVKWKWPRKLKVLLLTLAVVLMTVVLLFFPEEDYNERVVTVAWDDPISFDLDQAYREQGRNSGKIMRLVLEGSFMPDEAVDLARLDIYSATIGSEGKQPPANVL